MDKGSFERSIERYEDKLDPVQRDELVFNLTHLMPDRLVETIGKRKTYAGFGFPVVVRFLFSCLVDADFKDTATSCRRLNSGISSPGGVSP